MDIPQQRKIIKDWMLAVIAEGGIERFDDLHIDRIDRRWANRDLWVTGALDSFVIAVGIRNELSLNLTVSVGFSFESGQKPLAPNVGILDLLQNNFDWTPPSLYLFHKGQELWENNSGAVYFGAKDVEPFELFHRNLPASQCLYLEFCLENSEEYRRSLFLAG